MVEIFIQSFVLYFVVIDPIGSAPIFFVVTKNLNLNGKVKTAFNSTLIAFLVLIFFAVLGNYIFNHLNITIFSNLETIKKAIKVITITRSNDEIPMIWLI